MAVLDFQGSKDGYIYVTYKLSDYLMCLMFFRVYFVTRTLLNFTLYSDLYSQKICAKYGFEGGTSFQIKALYRKQTSLFILFLSTFSLFILAYLVRIFERPFYN